MARSVNASTATTRTPSAGANTISSGNPLSNARFTIWLRGRYHSPKARSPKARVASLQGQLVVPRLARPSRRGRNALALRTRLTCLDSSS